MADKALKRYAEKRHFEKTPEPGAEEASGRQGPLLFGIQKHAATRLHYDLRLELDGVLKSWAVPKGLSLDPGQKHLAVQVEDHPFDYLIFEGLIPEHEYGGGEVILWDTGIYQPDEPPELYAQTREEQETHVRKALEKGKLGFTLRGSKAKGSWALVRMKDERNWLLFKHKDGFEDPERDLTELAESALSGLTIEDLKSGALPADSSGLRALERENRLVSAPKKPMPMLASSADKPFDHPDYIFEPKLDGIRVLALIEGTSVKLISRNGLDITKQFPEIVKALAGQRLRQTLIDGEILAYGPDGKGNFFNTLNRLKQSNPLDVDRKAAELYCIYYPFDLLHLEGIDMMGYPLMARKLKLGQILLPNPSIRVVTYVEEDGKTTYEASVAAGFEGVVAKKRDSRYEMGRRSDCWRKIKPFQSAEFVVGGWTKGEGGRSQSLGSLMVGVFDDERKLVYAGNVGSGFNEDSLTAMKARLEALETKECPFTPKLPAKAGRWVKPDLIIEVKYLEWTPHGSLRAPVFLRVREDVRIQEVTMEGQLAEPNPEEQAGGSDASGILKQLDADKESLTLEVEGSQVKVSSLNKLYWPKSEDLAEPITKRDLLRYLASVGPYMLTHLRDRPFTMIRMPEGIHGERFFQKHWDAKLPEFVSTVDLYSESKKVDQRYIVCNNLATLLWLGQVASLESHVWASRYAKEPDGAHLSMQATGGVEQIESSILNYPDYISFDMDPYLYSGKEKEGEEPEFNEKAFDNAKEIALRFKEMIESIGLTPFIKTTGKTGLHIFAPIQRTLTFEEVRALCEVLSNFLVRERPAEVTTEWAVVKRTGKTFLDYNMNVRSKTLAAAYSPRSGAGAHVSMPFDWSELPKLYPYQFTFQNAIKRLSERGDAWKDIISHKRALDLNALK